MGRTDKEVVLRTLVAASSWAATSVETSSITERHTTGAPWMATPYFHSLPHAKIDGRTEPRRRGSP
jgi:hypothetical protein